MKQKHTSLNMQMGLWLSAVAILVSASSPFSNLLLVAGKDAMPVTPSGWSGPIVVTTGTGTNTSSAVLEGGNSVYIDIAITNNGNANITETFNTCLYFDVTTLVHCWAIAGLTSNTNFTVEDYEMTYIAVAAQSGLHSLQLKIDEAGAILSEANTGNNNFTGNFTWVETPGTLMADALTVADVNKPVDVNGDSNAPDKRDTSGYMIGKVAVSVILPESGIGGTENWSQTEIDQVKAEITEGLGDWETWYTANNGGNPGLDFVIEWHTNADAVPVPITDEPIALNSISDEDVWIREALGVLGATGTTYWDRAYAYDNTIRAANSADWAFTIFVVDSSSDSDGRFLPANTGSFAYSYLNGPFLVMTYDNADWGISQMSEALAHQVAHIFGAADQYSGCSGGDATTKFGYLEIANSNCGGVITTSSLMYAGQGAPDITTRQQVGWRDSDSTPDGIFDPADTRPAIETFSYDPVFTGTTLIFSGIAYDNPLMPPVSTRAITIRELIAIEYRIDGGAWQPASIYSTGTFDSDREDFSFDTGELGGGTHTVDVRAQNNSTDPVNQYSIVGADQEGISRITKTFANDLFASPVIIPSLPYTSTGINTTNYTGGEPQDLDLIACGGDINVNRTAGDHSAWYRYTPTITESVTLDTIGSVGSVGEFDTMIGVYLYEFSSLSQIDCNDDGAANLKSIVTVALTAGKTYYFVVSSFSGIPPSANGTPPPSAGASASSTKPDIGPLSGGFDPGGDLVFHVISNGAIDDINVSVAGAHQGTYLLLQGSSTRQSYSGVNNGPLNVMSTNTNIIASTRVIYGGVSYSEMMGFPANKLTNNYWFPYYNNVAMNSQLRVSNVGGVSTTITVTYGNNIPLDSFTLVSGAAIRKNYAGINSGPLHVTSSSSNILTTLRVVYGGLSYSELTGFPNNQLTTDYWFPYYNNVAMNSQVRVSNVGGISTTITVTYGNNIPLDSYTLAPGVATRKNYTGINSGPLHVTSSVSNILTTIRVLYGNQSFSELSGFPANQLTTEYWYPVYDNVLANSQLRISNVGGVSTTITVYGVKNTVIDTYTLAAGAATRKNYAGVNDGPLHVVSSVSNILSTQRLLYTTPSFGSFYELTGFPNNQLTTDYYFPWYNNIAMSSQLRIAVP